MDGLEYARFAELIGRIIETGNAIDIYHNPRHPYTLALLKSVPRLDQPRKAKLDPVEGQPPDLTRLDDGCSFRPRCRYAVERCAREFPPLDSAGDPNHRHAGKRKGSAGRR